VHEVAESIRKKGFWGVLKHYAKTGWRKSKKWLKEWGPDIAKGAIKLLLAPNPSQKAVLAHNLHVRTDLEVKVKMALEYANYVKGISGVPQNIENFERILKWL